MQSNPLHALLVMHLEAFPPGSYDEAARHVFTTEREHVEFRFDGQTVRLPRRLFTLAALAFVGQCEEDAEERLENAGYPATLAEQAHDWAEPPAALAMTYPAWVEDVIDRDELLRMQDESAIGYGFRSARVGKAPVDQFGNISDLTGGQLKYAQDSGGGDE